MNKRNYLFFAIPLLLAFVFAFSVVNFNTPIEDNPLSIKYNSNVCVYKNNELLGECYSNLVTTAGLNAIKDGLGQGSLPAAYDYVALCNATAGCTDPAAGDTALDNEYAAGGLSRAQGTYSSNGNGNWTISKTFTATADSLVTNMTGLFNASSSGTMLAENNFTSVTLQTNDQLTINWTIWVS